MEAVSPEGYTYYFNSETGGELLTNPASKNEKANISACWSVWTNCTGKPRRRGLLLGLTPK